ncbi:restriction endonuclease subunit M [Cryobacterium shii]|uniref:Restriction endonuclease subunit M n=2 Tax=Cryobacterium shii TaxID=1259235 RepID=A0AAQ2HFU9_9MICO|nr:restriction endonuclease subunit M [Cryobacterium shii]
MPHYTIHPDALSLVFAHHRAHPDSAGASQDALMIPSNHEDFGMTASVNKFGSLADLSSEASVEQFFVNRLLTDLGYNDAQIKPKATLDELTVSKGRKGEKWRPDYAIVANGRVRWICEAKSVDEDLGKWTNQSSGYCFALNRAASDNPVEFYMLTNGVTTRVYRWDSDEYLIEASYRDFTDGNLKFQEIRELLAPTSFNPVPEVAGPSRHKLTRHSVAELNADFAWAHKIIYTRESLSYTAAFMEFVKVIFLKLHSDRTAHNSANIREEPNDAISVPAGEVKFSRAWIESREHETTSPLDAVLFRNLVKEFELEIAQNRKKRIFGKDEKLELSPETLKVLVGRLESVDLISIDADLNGRMFETFLNSTLRGKDLGQFFTPRSVVKLATGLAQLQAGPDRIDRVIDACSGTGGFLIEALSDMWAKIESNASLSDVKKEQLKRQVAEQSIIGIDVARDPALARIARINMYLHGDGGTSIFQLDSLDKSVTVSSNDSIEIAQEKNEFRQRVAEGWADTGDGPRGIADVALTNPPFAKEYDRKQPNEARLLDEYALSFDTTGGAKRPIPSLSSMVMFLERYYELLAPGGRLVTVLDDGILGAPANARVRRWIREHWIVKAVVSLPGDAFQRSQARVKTSILVLEKKLAPSEKQPDVFMYYCTVVGVDDAPRQRILPIDAENRKRATEEIQTAVSLYRSFQSGDPVADAWRVPAKAIADRMDVKACLPESGNRVPDWVAAGFEVKEVDDLLELAASGHASDRIIDTKVDDELVTYLRVRYDGFCEAGEEIQTSDVAAQKLTRVEAGDIIFSHINAIHGAVGVVPIELEGCVVTSEYTVCRAKPGLSASVIWTLLRAPQTRADMLLLSTGIGRTRVKWNILRTLKLPIPDEETQTRISRALDKANRAERQVDELRTAAKAIAENELLLGGEAAQNIIAAFRPPR